MDDQPLGESPDLDATVVGRLLDVSDRIARQAGVIRSIRALHRRLNWEVCTNCGADTGDCFCEDDPPVESRHVCEECRDDEEPDRLAEWPCRTMQLINEWEESCG